MYTHLLYCSLLSLGGNVNTRQLSKLHMGSIFHIKKSMKYSGHRKLLCELSNSSKFNAFNLLGYYTSTDVYKFHPERTGFNLYAEYTQLQLTFLALHPCCSLRLVYFTPTSASLPISTLFTLLCFLPSHCQLFPFFYSPPSIPSVFTSQPFLAGYLRFFPRPWIVCSCWAQRLSIFIPPTQTIRVNSW